MLALLARRLLMGAAIHSLRGGARAVGAGSKAVEGAVSKRGGRVGSHLARTLRRSRYSLHRKTFGRAGKKRSARSSIPDQVKTIGVSQSSSVDGSVEQLKRDVTRGLVNLSGAIEKSGKVIVSDFDEMGDGVSKRIHELTRLRPKPQESSKSSAGGIVGHVGVSDRSGKSGGGAGGLLALLGLILGGKKIAAIALGFGAFLKKFGSKGLRLLGKMGKKAIPFLIKAGKSILRGGKATFSFAWRLGKTAISSAGKAILKYGSRGLRLAGRLGRRVLPDVAGWLGRLAGLEGGAEIGAALGVEGGPLGMLVGALIGTGIGWGASKLWGYFSGGNKSSASKTGRKKIRARTIKFSADRIKFDAVRYGSERGPIPGIPVPDAGGHPHWPGGHKTRSQIRSGAVQKSDTNIGQIPVDISEDSVDVLAKHGIRRGKANLFSSGRRKGTPGDHGNMTTITVQGQSWTVRKEAAPSFEAFLKDLTKRGYKLKSSGGFNMRRKRGGTGWSEHAYGNAIDINALSNPMGNKLVTDLPSNISDIAASYGLTWGGDWRGKKDAMHFEWSGIPASEVMADRNQMAGGVVQVAPPAPRAPAPVAVGKGPRAIAKPVPKAASVSKDTGFGGADVAGQMKFAEFVGVNDH